MTGRTIPIHREGMGMGATRNYRSSKGPERRRMIVAFVASYHEANRRPPSIREIGKEIGVPSTGLISYYLNRLEVDGILRRSYNTARSVMIAEASS